MTVVLFRVDERLIHGQVIVGWGGRLHPDRIVVVDDELAGSPWEQELYTMGVPAGVEAGFASVAEALEQLPGWLAGEERVLILTRTIEAMNRLASTGLLRDQEINIGGIHHGPGRVRVLRYVFLSEEEKDALVKLSDAVATVAARDVPGARGVGLDELVGDS